MTAKVDRDRSVAVLGAGLSGLAASQRLREQGFQVDVYEKQPHVGGHAYSYHMDGFTFDQGPHVSFTSRPEIKTLFSQAVNGQYTERDAEVLNYWQGHIVRHPAQCNLYGLPVEMVERCVLDIIKARYEGDDHPIETYADWCYKSLGRTFSEEFTLRYTRKYWTAEASNMSADWVGSRMYIPNLEDVIRGALKSHTDNYHYITHFRYPEHGGFGSYVQAVAAGQDVNLGCEVASIDLQRRRMEFINGREAYFDKLISSLPIPELIRRIKDVPESVSEAAKRLTCTSLVLVNVGVVRDKGFPDAHWMYFYDEDIIFARGNFPHRLSPNNVPPGCGSIQVEVYHSKYRPLPCEDVLNRSMEDMYKSNLLSRDDRVIFAREQRIPYANILFDLERASSLAIVQDYLNDKNIACCGRYGEWAYYWSDDSVLSGWHAAEKVIAE